MKPSSPQQTTKRRKKWRELTDEERWERIYADREREAAKRIDSLEEAVALALPPYAMHEAICDLHANTNVAIRDDTFHSIVGSVALVASRVKNKDRDALADKLAHAVSLVKTSGFYLTTQEFLYAVAMATLKLVEEGHYPADAPATLAAAVLVEDAHSDESEWGLSEAHAVKAVGWAFDSLLVAGSYEKPG